MIQAIHTAVKGRARFRIGDLYRSKALESYLEHQLAEREAIQQISASALTGNLLVEYDSENRLADIETQIEATLADYQASEEKSELESPSKSRSKSRPATERQRQRSKSRETPGDAQKQPVEDWHRLDAETVLEKFETSKTAGLSPQVAETKLQTYGPNRLSESKSRSDFSLLVKQFNSLPVALLGAAAGISLVTGGAIDAVVILGVVCTNAVIGYTTESQSEKIIRSLKQDDESVATVIRDGRRTEIDAEEIVPGDLIVLQSGRSIGADARLLKCEGLEINESALTGESAAVSKSPQSLTGEEIPLAERTNMAYKGTLVTGGEGLAIAVATGRFTEIGQIQRMVGEAESTATLLQTQIDQVGQQLVLLGSGVCGAIFGIGLLRGYGVLNMLKTSISLAVASVPEGLPTIATTTLALGIRDMRQRHILIRGLEAVEALGSVQTVCLDKTGTITQNKMVVEEVYVNGNILKPADFESEPDDSLAPALAKLIQVGVLCSESEINQTDSELEVSGSATENALVYLAMDAGMDVIQLRHDHPLLETNLRSQDRNVMSTVHKREGGQFLIAVKGSPAEVLERCTQQLQEGEVVPLTGEARQTIASENEQMAGRALRVLGVAYRDADAPEDPERDLVWLGLTGMADPIREGVPDLMAAFHRAGMDTVMITGDQSPTAYAIAKKLNLSRDQKLKILDSADLAKLEPEKMQALFNKVNVFARVSPADKLKIVQALQASGKTVAMTGDGINDTPALKAANVGVAMGSGGGSVVREVADVVVEDDNLQTLIEAVSQGRTTYNNIRKSVHFLLSTNLSEIIVTTIAIITGLGEPLTTMELLWLNLVSDIFPGLALALEPPEPDVLDQPPRDPDQPIIQASDFQRIAFESTVISLCALAAYGYGVLRYGRNTPKASTLLFMSLTIGQVLHTWSCRSEHHSLFSKDPLPRNPYVEGAIAGSIGLQLLPLVIPGLRNLLGLALLDPLDCLVIGSSAILPLLINEGTKTTKQNVTKQNRTPQPA